MTVIGNPRSFHKKFKFIVEIDDVGHAGFQKCSELSVEVANVQYFEGGSLIPNKSPGRLTFSDVTLERGATEDRDLFDWFQDVAITSSGLGLTDVNYKRNLDVVQQDRDGVTLRRWSLSRAWPIKFVAGEWDNESDENVIDDGDAGKRLRKLVAPPPASVREAVSAFEYSMPSRPTSWTLPVSSNAEFVVLLMGRFHERSHVVNVASLRKSWRNSSELRPKRKAAEL